MWRWLPIQKSKDIFVFLLLYLLSGYSLYFEGIPTTYKGRVIRVVALVKTETSHETFCMCFVLLLFRCLGANGREGALPDHVGMVAWGREAREHVFLI